VSQEAAYMATAMGMARAGLGLAVLPAAAVEAAGQAGLVAIAIRRPILRRRIDILRRADRSLSAAAESLVLLLKRTR
jgi:DNA-binding transcriptional LysR family regulator